MKLESTQNRRPEGDPEQKSDQLDKQRNRHRKETHTSPQLRLPDPPDPDNLPVDYPGRSGIEWP
ncbi:hypothetical protein [Arthrobacter sp. FW306-04-A]|uniref:hypothetical protein n=1 Tax=Arthrobacter sp. FW306-04-A TaxID=2879619 RepID=UPI0037C02D8A|nr:hypothetical protein LFT43_01060 [Arthrobacter sp. FW306-04-A]